MSDQYTGVLDRFEDEEAVLLLGADGETVGDLIVERDMLPTDGAHQDAVFTVRLSDDGDLETIEYRPDRTAQRNDRAQSRFDRLSKRPPSPADDADPETDNAADSDPNSRTETDEDG